MAVVEAIVAERAGVLALAKAHCGQIDAMAARGSASAGEAAAAEGASARLRRPGLRRALHVETADDRAVRTAMRARLKDQEEEDDHGQS